MRRWGIVIRRRGVEHRVVLGPLTSLLATFLLATVGIFALLLAVVSGYILLSVILVAALVVGIIAVVRDAWLRIRI